MTSRFCNHLFIYIYIFFSAVQHGDPVILTCIHSFSSHYIFRHKWLGRIPSATQQDANPSRRHHSALFTVVKTVWCLGCFHVLAVENSAAVNSGVHVSFRAMPVNRGVDQEEVEHRHNGISLSHSKDKILAFSATWVDLEIILLSEVSQAMRHQHQMLSLTCGIWKKDTMDFFAKQILTHRLWKIYGFQRRQFWGVGGCTAGVGWKSYKIGLWWSLFNYKCNKFIE